MARPRFEIYTDGGADPNPGPGGWGAVVIDRESGATRELSGNEARSTNNRMELSAAIGALESLPPGAAAEIHTDSIYLQKGVTQWLPGWIRRGWKRKGGELQNKDLWQRLAALIGERPLRWHWLKGHAGHRHNERADRLASAAIRGRRQASRPAPAAVPEVEAELYVKVSGGGGWAVLVRRDGEQEMLRGSLPGASSNELDLTAAAEALAAQPVGAAVAVYIGSDYLRNGATRWLPGWRSGGWKTKAGSPVQNRAAWERLERAMAPREVYWRRAEDGGLDPEQWKALAKAARDRS